MAGDWEHGLFGCFNNCGICLISYFVPCYQFGKNAEAVGESCCLCCLSHMFPPVHLVTGTIIRGKVRASKNIDGSCLTDFLAVLCCPCCVIAQEAQEVKVAPTTTYIQRA